MSEQESSSRRAFFQASSLSLLGAAAMRALGQTSQPPPRTRPPFGVMGAIQDRFVASRCGAPNLRPEIAR
jgi:hypothetical protein